MPKKSKKPPIENTNRRRIKINNEATIEDFKELIGKKCRFRVARGESQLLVIEQINFVDDDVIFIIRDGKQKYKRSYKKISFVQLNEPTEVKEEKSKFDKILDEVKKDADTLPKWKQTFIAQADKQGQHEQNDDPI